ncbi:short-subunit dehydrogenase [Panacagrimonas perspica]|uniref:Short-subunit dehydrogenase n=1 Tax=Panacagrimonas perspica TaxID=381431 RepID=A0A4S3K205_9GAMM|nr:SDR family oxidoreductase [Panacagrimonas perspica]TDU26374.1 short-subunit dehydrogenase [Panacagrimonas perspica]THD02010.1 hypothetical protein B1810_16040 [Panacagrimonas perspica]
MTTYVVTGADRGIGAAMCAVIAERGDKAIAACLGHGRELVDAPNLDIVTGVDVASTEGVRRLTQHIDTRQIDVLINNAGLVTDQMLGQFDYDAMMREYAVNALGPLRVTEALLPRIGRGGKVCIISSRVGSLSENGIGGLYGYRMSKAAANMAGLNLSHELKTRGIAVLCLHPGSVRTEMTAGLADQATVGTLAAPRDAARALLERIDELNLETTGQFRHANGQMLSW